jgi:UDP-N-acetylglucosamine diphosphorylase / glucose-1-phosphate thymidylyltransferase / UDP-N-acetylgalactosamine diphosphorylase / glucosamine-1-phosphate N-acetyltransferase / galactosamine-1-phosphate N-acetyltransferase
MQPNNSLILQDQNCFKNFYPFTHTMHTGELLVGAFTIAERWQLLTEKEIVLKREETAIDNTQVIDAAIMPQLYGYHFNNAFDFVKYNGEIIKKDFELYTHLKSNHISATNKTLGGHAMYIGKQVQMQYCYLNTEEGPIIIEDNVVVMEGSILKGPLVLKTNAVVKAGSIIYGGTTIGKKCVVGGEIKNSIFLYASNKIHQDYIGDSYVGAWCNFGAGTNVSNTKNTGGTIFYYNEHEKDLKAVGKKAGVLMGHYSRTAINTAINSGSVVGICSHVFGIGLTPKFINHFSWGFQNETPYSFNEAIDHINNWMAMKQEFLQEDIKEQLEKLYKNVQQ